jgi:hypothetical protein
MEEQQRVMAAENSLRAVLSVGRGAYVDGKNIRWDTNNSDFEGYLTKKSKWMGEWRKRYFILKGSKIFFSKDSTSPPHGMIDLVDCIAVKPAEKKTNKKNALEITLKDEFFHLCALTDRDKDEWIARIGKAIVKNSGMFISDQYTGGNPGDDNSDDNYSEDGDSN